MQRREIPFLFAALLLAIVLPTASLPTPQVESNVNIHETYLQNAITAMNTLMTKWYNPANGLWDDMWWNSANSLTSLANFAALNMDDFMPIAKGYFETTFVAAQDYSNGDFLNNFYDDEGWWAMAWLRIYDLTGNSTYLEAANDIFKGMLTGADATCGGIWWSEKEDYNAAISNELYLAVSASLANRVHNSEYAAIAKRQAEWFLDTGLINENSTINDGLNISNCEVVGPTFTYNSGVILGGLIEMHRLTSQQKYLDIASNIANGAIRTLSDEQGILTEIGYPGPGDRNWSQFKGIFVRNLGYLQAVAGDKAHVSFLQANADAIWKQKRNNNSFFGPNWQGPWFEPNAASQTSALDCLVGAAAVS